MAAPPMNQTPQKPRPLSLLAAALEANSQDSHTQLSPAGGGTPQPTSLFSAMGAAPSSSSTLSLTQANFVSAFAKPSVHTLAASSGPDLRKPGDWSTIDFLLSGQKQKRTSLVRHAPGMKLDSKQNHEEDDDDDELDLDDHTVFPGGFAPVPPPALKIQWSMIEILHCVQVLHLFLDSKEFVDMPLNRDPKDIFHAWAIFKQQCHTRMLKGGRGITKGKLKRFVAKYFDAAGSDLMATSLDDGIEVPPVALKVKDKQFRTWATTLNVLWAKLARRTVPDVGAHPTRHSLIDQRRPFLVPGGRFNEFYYWDSFWIIKGLVICGRLRTAQGIIKNMVDMVNKYGFVPNGSRKYYLNRSQPPLLCEMVMAYHRGCQEYSKSKVLPTDLHELAVKSIDFVGHCLPALEKEYAFWMNPCTKLVNLSYLRRQRGQSPSVLGSVENKKGHGVTITQPAYVKVNDLCLNRYYVATKEPRPESYREDLDLAASMGLNEDEAADLYGEIAAAAESGWDFTSRWFKDSRSLKTIHIRSIIPVDLNSVLYKYEVNLAELWSEWNAHCQECVDQDVSSEDDEKDDTAYAAHGDNRRASLSRSATRASVDSVIDKEYHLTGSVPGNVPFYRKQASRRLKAITEFLWSEDRKQWMDLDIESLEHKPIVSSSNFSPLWAGAYTEQQAAAAVDEFANSHLSQQGGVVGTLLYTREQWDFPNGWAPLQWFIVEGLRNTGLPKARKLAKDIALAWLYNNFGGFKLSSGRMFEKYDVRVWGYRGFGGEYEPQDGFGWTNGVVLCFLDTYGQDVSYEEFSHGLDKDQSEYERNSVMAAIKLTYNTTKGRLKELVRRLLDSLDTYVGACLERQPMSTPMRQKAPRTQSFDDMELPMHTKHSGSGRDISVNSFSEPAQPGRLKLNIPQEQKGIIPEDDVASELRALSLSTMRSCVAISSVRQRAPRDPTKADPTVSTMVVMENWVFYWEDMRSLAVTPMATPSVGSPQSPAFRLHPASASFSPPTTGSTLVLPQATIAPGFHELVAVGIDVGSIEPAFVPPNEFDRCVGDETNTTFSMSSVVSEQRLPDLVRMTLRKVTSEQLLRPSKKLQQADLWTMELLKEIEQDTSDNLDAVKALLLERFDFSSMRKERQRIREVVRRVVYRAGRVTSTAVVAAALRRDSLTKLRIYVHSPSLASMATYRKAIRGFARQMLGHHLQVHVRVPDPQSLQDKLVDGLLMASREMVIDMSTVREVPEV